jgi:hypothetical protein
VNLEELVGCVALGDDKAFTSAPLALMTFPA